MCSLVFWLSSLGAPVGRFLIWWENKRSCGTGALWLDTGQLKVQEHCVQLLAYLVDYWCLVDWVVVCGWLVGMWLEKNIKSAPMSYTCLCFMFLYRQYCNYLIWESIKLEIGWFLISLCCICRTSYKKPEWQIQLIFYCVMTDTRHLFDENATKVN